MGIREKINTQPGIGVGFVLVLFLIAGAVAYKLYRPLNTYDPNGVFYSDDDGQTYFKDSLYKFAPFDHDGKTALMAAVFSNGDQNFVGYVERYTPATKRKLEDAYAQVQGGTMTIAEIRRLIGSKDISENGREVKLPGPSNKWVPLSNSSHLKMNVPGGGPCFPINP